MKENLLKQLKGVYKTTNERDVFGRRPALPSEIRTAIEPQFPQDIDSYLPNDEDLIDKGDPDPKKI